MMNDKQYRAHTLVSRLITFDRVLFLAVIGVALGLFGFAYITAAHHAGQLLNEALAHVRQ